MVPTRGNMEDQPDYQPPDLYDFIPATKPPSDERTEQRDSLGKQAEPTTDVEGIEIISGDQLQIPPMLKCHIHEVNRKPKTFPRPKADETKLLQYYLFDASSILPVLALGLQPSDKVLDLCAAPGGKTLAICQTLLPAQVTCVDSSASRLLRLRDTIKWYIPGRFTEEENGVVLHQDDGRDVGNSHASEFDKVLVDAPCNTDRQVLQEDDNSLFKRSRVTERLQLPIIQTDLLKSGIKACKPGGSIVYSTCTLTPGQNDHVIQTAITELQAESNIKVAVLELSAIRERFAHIFKFWPHAKYGQTILPCPEANFGPTYFAKLTRLQ